MRGSTSKGLEKRKKNKEIRYLIVLRFFLSQSFSTLGMR